MTQFYNKYEPTTVSPEMNASMDALAERFKAESVTTSTLVLPPPIEDLPSDVVEVEKAYVCGPMSGMDGCNFAAFDAASKILRDLGYFVVSPAEMDRDAGFSGDVEMDDYALRQAFERDLKEICWCEKVALLPGWDKSAGARAEVAVAMRLGLTFIEAMTGLSLGRDPHETWYARKPGQILTAAAAIAETCKDPNPKDVIGSGKVPMGLVSDIAVAEESLALTEGNLKYGAYNYRAAPVKASVYVDAAKRHIAKWVNGEDRDQKTRVHHLGSVRACFGIILDAAAQGTLIDDRPPSNPRLAEILDGMAENVGHLRETFKGHSPKHYSIKDSA